MFYRASWQNDGFVDTICFIGILKANSEKQLISLKYAKFSNNFGHQCVSLFMYNQINVIMVKKDAFYVEKV